MSADSLPGALVVQLVVLQVSGVIDWPWWCLAAPLAALPLERLATRLVRDCVVMWWDTRDAVRFRRSNY